MSIRAAVSGTETSHDHHAPRRAGLLLAGGGLLALCYPLAFPADILAADSLGEAYRTIDERAGGWRLANAVLAVAVIAVAAGYRQLSQPLREGGQSRLAAVGWWTLVAFAVAGVVEAAVRVVYTTGVAGDVAGGATPATGFPATWGARPSPLLIMGSMLGLVALVAFAVGARRVGLVGGVVGWIATVTALTMVLSEPAIPLLVSVLPLGAGVMLRDRAGRSSVRSAPGAQR